jgi:hypothetical protein
MAKRKSVLATRRPMPRLNDDAAWDALLEEMVTDPEYQAKFEADMADYERRTALGQRRVHRAVMDKSGLFHYDCMVWVNADGSDTD